MGIQIFHVLEHKGNGGETMLSDGFTALKILLEQDQDAFKFLTEFNLRHEYKENGQPGHHLHSVGTVIGKLKTGQAFSSAILVRTLPEDTTYGGSILIIFNKYTFSLSFPTVSQFNDAYLSIKAL